MPTTAGAAGLEARLCAQLCKVPSEHCLFYKLRVSTSWINCHNFSSLQHKLEYSNLSYHPCSSPSDNAELRNAVLLWMQSYPRSTRNVSLHTLGFRLGLNLWGKMVEIIWPMHSPSADMSFRWLLYKCLVKDNGFALSSDNVCTVGSAGETWLNQPTNFMGKKNNLSKIPWTREIKTVWCQDGPKALILKLAES